MSRQSRARAATRFPSDRRECRASRSNCAATGRPSYPRLFCRPCEKNSPLALLSSQASVSANKGAEGVSSSGSTNTGFAGRAGAARDADEIFTERSGIGSCAEFDASRSANVTVELTENHNVLRRNVTMHTGRGPDGKTRAGKLDRAVQLPVHDQVFGTRKFSVNFY